MKTITVTSGSRLGATLKAWYYVLFRGYRFGYVSEKVENKNGKRIPQVRWYLFENSPQ